MKIIVLGAGQVGASVAETLSSEANDITVVDNEPRRLHELQERFDLRTVLGEAAHPDVLRRAGAEDADMIIAVTNSDETNMVACQVAYTLFHTPTKIARVRARDYLDEPDLFSQEALPIDVVISPEKLVIDQLQRLIEYPGALQVLDFAGGRAQLVAIQAYSDGPLVGHQIRDLASRIPGDRVRVAAIFRRGSPIIPQGETVIEAGDEVFFIAPTRDIRAVMGEMRHVDREVRRIMLVGGGNIGLGLAAALEQRYHIKVIEHNPVRVQRISQELSRSLVLLGDAADEELLVEENIENTDVFCAVTNDDEANILSGMLAKRLGARKVISLINRSAYVDLVQSGDMVHSLRRGAAEAIEAVAHGDRKTSRVVNRAVGEIRLPPQTTIGAIVRGDEVIMAHHDTVIEAEDHVILFVVDKKRIAEVERLFQVGVTFF
jgi:trk system potassium uptake protein TrkA